MILTILAMSLTLMSLGAELRVDAQGNVFTAAVDFEHEVSGKRVYFVGLTHQGSKVYYERLTEHTETWLQSAGDRTLVLTEGVTCSGEVWDSLSRSLSQDNLVSLERAQIDFSPINFLSKDDDELRPLIDAYALTKMPCSERNSYSQTVPFHAFEYGRNGCERARSLGRSCPKTS